MPCLLWPLPRGVSSANDHSTARCYFTWPANGFINHLPCWPDKPLRASSNHPRPVRNLSLTWSEILLLLVRTPKHLLFNFRPTDSGPYQTSFHTRSSSHGGRGGSQPLSGMDESLLFFSLSFHRLTLWPNSSETLGQGQPPPSTSSVDVAGRGLKINDHFFGTKSVSYEQKNQFSRTLDLSILKDH